MTCSRKARTRPNCAACTCSPPPSWPRPARRWTPSAAPSPPSRQRSSSPSGPRTTHARRPGEFLQARERVTAAIPAALGTAREMPKDRLGFARWLVSNENPLTARVVANRHWAAFFGTGIVRTVEDFGLQGELPSHPELLDWLALAYREGGWATKALHRLIG